MREIRIFNETELSDFLEQKKRKILASIKNENENYLLNVNKNDYTKYKFEQARIELLQIHADKLYISLSKQKVPAEHFPLTFNVEPGNFYEKDIIHFHIPISGNIELIECRPSHRLLWTMSIELNGNEMQGYEIVFKKIIFDTSSETIKREMNSNIDSILAQLKNVNSEVDYYNKDITRQINNTFEITKNKIINKNNILESLDIPIKRSDNVSSTFSVPVPNIRKKISLVKPVANETRYVPEPTLNKEIYSHILRLINDIGKEFERLPSLYANKKEEHLRDHFLMMIEPHFDGSATGI